MHLNGEQLTFLARFSKSPEAAALLGLLRAKLAERDANLRIKVGEEVYRQQGRALELDELIADITQANARLNRGTPTRTSEFRAAA